MKKLILTIFALCLSVSAALAVPAYPGLIKYTQPDGSEIWIQLHGDEFFHWATTESGQVVALSEDGFWRESSISEEEIATARQLRIQADAMRMQAMGKAPRGGVLKAAGGNVMTQGQRRIPVFLVQFQDVQFVLNNVADRFNRLLNEKGYSDDGATGSVRDYYFQNSHEVFEPIFDVYGPVTLSRNMSYYGSDSGGRIDIHASDAVVEAAQQLNATVDFSQYDYDNDGYIDMTLMYYAGYNQAEGASSEAIWPHQSYVSSNQQFDNKRLSRYFCTSELKGRTGQNMCGIGTTCHEFGHSLGLPDFYDTDYSSNGQAGALYSFSIMCSGSYNNSSRTPPRFNAIERNILDWMTDDDIMELEPGYNTIPSIKQDQAYKLSTDVEGEFFLLETRDGSSWDAYLPQGMVLYHVDQSRSHTVGGMSAYQQWAYWEYYNTINAYGSHPCFYVVPSGNPNSLNYSGAANRMVYPGVANVTTYYPVTWDKHDQTYMLDQITYMQSTGTTTVLLRDPEQEPDDSIKYLHQMGYNSIDPGKGYYAAGDVFQFKLIEADSDKPKTVKWTFDSKAVSGSSVTLTEGVHVVEATLTYSDGRKEVIEMEIDLSENTTPNL